MIEDEDEFFEMIETSEDIINNSYVSLFIDYLNYVNGWYFCDEIGEYHGPFNTYKAAVLEYKLYMRSVL